MLSIYGIGNAVADPELQYIGANNTPKCTVNLAFNRSYQQNGEWKREATYLNAEVWGKQAEKLNELARKGKAIFVSGYLRQNNWTDDKGQKRSRFVINVNEFRMCEGFGNGKKTEAKAQTNEPVGSTAGADNGADSDIPF